MEKFLSIPVTSEGDQLVSLKNIALIEKGSDTTLVITYQGGKVVTLTHDTDSAFVIRNEFQVQMKNALATTWDRVVVDYAPSLAVSGIAVA